VRNCRIGGSTLWSSIGQQTDAGTFSQVPEITDGDFRVEAMMLVHLGIIQRRVQFKSSM
jgi:hypothetical protein